MSSALGAPQWRARTFSSPWVRDFTAAFAVFLIAIPLCLGIAHAAGAPPLSGLVAGAVGGLVVGALSGSALSVSGPAAGLIVLVLAGIETFGAQGFALCVMLAGALQLLLGGLGMGRLAQFVPNSVVRAMLAAIGLVLILKQIPHALGYDADYEGDHNFFQPDGENTLSGLWHGVRAIHPGALIVSCAAILVFLVFRHPRLQRVAHVFPRELAAVLFATMVSEALVYTPFALGVEHRLDLPKWSGSYVLFGGDFWTASSWHLLATTDVWRMAFSLAFIASIETLLCVEAVDRLDRQARITPRNRELLAQGAGNMISGLLGGLPITAVIVRSVANVHAGARTRVATMTHGVFLLLAMWVLPTLLVRIPLASLAVVLIGVGGKLTRLELYRTEWQKGLSHFLPFALTVVAVLFTDILVGTLLGVAASLVVLLLREYRSAVLVMDDGPNRLIRLRNDIAFVHRPLLSRAFSRRSGRHEVVVDGSRVRHMDEEIIELLQNAELGRAETLARVTVLRNPANTHAFFRDDEV